VQARSTRYAPGPYEAPWLSIDESTECHPGLFFASRSWCERAYPSEDLVRIRAHRIEGKIVHAGSKWRCKRLEVIGPRGGSPVADPAYWCPGCELWCPRDECPRCGSVLPEISG